MLVNLPNGKTIEMSFEQYISMTDEDFQYLVASGYGEEINDPFHNSFIRNGEIKTVELDEEEEVYEEIDEELDIDETEEY
jgi:hypothetical protein